MNKYSLWLLLFVIIFVVLGLRFTYAQTSKKNVNETEGKLKTDLSEFKSGTVKVFDVKKNEMVEIKKVYKAEEEWKKQLTQEEFNVAFRQGTERPFTGKLNSNKESGVYKSKISGSDLFHSDHKFDSGTGWPSFYKPVHDDNIILKEDNSLFMKRVEVVDKVSGAHLGHVFNDGPPPTGLRFCINSAALEFVPDVPYKFKK